MEELKELVPEQRQVAKRIAATPVTTTAGLQVRALILVDMFKSTLKKIMTTTRIS